MRHKGLVIALVVVVALFGGSFLLGMISYLLFGSTSDDISFSDKVGVVTVEGRIVTADKVVDELERFRKNNSIKAVILRVESPGGSVGASQEILEAVKKLREKKPVVAAFGSVAASGGYYVALAANKILATPGTITGSIGVRMEHVMIGDLLKWAKVQHETLKSGKFKDLAAFDRPMTEEERKVLQGVLNDIHEQFKNDVATLRNIDKSKIDEIADGRVYTGRQAKELGLIDELGGLTQAISVAGELAGIKGEPKVVYPKKGFKGFKEFLESATNVLSGKSSVGSFSFWQPMFYLRVQ